VAPVSEVVAEIQIDAPRSLVWAAVMDPERLSDWVTIHRHLGHHDSGPPRVGFKMNQTLSLRGAPFRVKWTLVRCEDPERAEWHGKGPAKSHAETEYHLIERDGGTLFRYRNEFEAPLGLVGRVAQRAIAGDIPQVAAKRSLERLKKLCETT
jgi:uncharacterized protein YndB with AHSA1/START domain